MQEIGRQYHYAEVTSTSDVARRLALEGAPAGTVVTADRQSRGRGRHGRTWISAAGQSLLMSVVLRPRLSAHDSGLITVASALAVAETIDEVSSLPATIKWPNDVLINGRKASGILLEAVQSGSTGGVEFVVVGIGINVLQEQFPSELSNRATSLLLESGRRFSHDELRDRTLDRLSNYMDALHNGDFETVRVRYRSRLAGMAEKIVLHPTSREASRIEGVLRGIDSSGGALIETSPGTIRTFFAGEVTTVPPNGQTGENPASV